MPCDSIQTTTTTLTHANKALLLKALRALGLEPQTTQEGIRFKNGQWAKGQLTTRGGSVTALDIKRAYSREIVSHAATQFGWTLSEQATTRRGVAATFHARRG